MACAAVPCIADPRAPDTYQRCLLANRERAPQECAAYKTALSACAAEAVPLLSAVKARCAGAVRAYDECLAANRGAADDELASACTPVLKRLWECTEAVKREEAQKEQRAKAGIDK